MDHHKRNAIKQQYPASKTWAEKVDAMPDSQVLAVYSRLVSKNMSPVKLKEFKKDR